MIKKITYSLFVLGLSTAFYSCDVDDGSDDSEESTTISDEAISGLYDFETFTPETVFYQQTSAFGDEGYEFKLFLDETVCDGFQTIGNIEFFVASDTALSVGEYEGQGPFFFIKSDEGTNSISFLGAEVVITEVSENEISGKVRGGREGENYIEGAFTAQFCEY